MAAVSSALTSRLRYISALIYNYTKKAFIVVAGGFEKAIALINEVVERILGAVARTLSSNSPFSDNTARNIAGSPVEITAGNPAAQSADIGSNRSLEEPSSYTREVDDWHNIGLELRSKIHGAQGPPSETLEKAISWALSFIKSAIQAVVARGLSSKSTKSEPSVTTTTGKANDGSWNALG